VNGRFTATDGRRNFIIDETALGTNRFGGAANRQLIVLAMPGGPSSPLISR
jgi:hypothetical protein